LLQQTLPWSSRNSFGASRPRCRQLSTMACSRSRYKGELKPSLSRSAFRPSEARNRVLVVKRLRTIRFGGGVARIRTSPGVCERWTGWFGPTTPQLEAIRFCSEHIGPFGVTASETRRLAPNSAISHARIAIRVEPSATESYTVALGGAGPNSGQRITVCGAGSCW
jgi:hypothetical protein